jgi:hypothetical protein
MRVIVYLIGFVLLVGLAWVLSNAICDHFEYASRPPAASPEYLPQAVDRFKPSKIVDHSIQDADTNWRYVFNLEASAPVREVLAYYTEVYPDTYKPTDETRADPYATHVARKFEFTPKDNKLVPSVSIIVGPPENKKKTPIRIEELKVKTGFIPDRTSVFLIMTCAFILLARSSKALALIEHVEVLQAKRKGIGTVFVPHDEPISDPQVLAAWKVWQDPLEANSFMHFVDFSVEAEEDNCARTMTKDHNVFATMYYMKTPEGPRTWIEIVSFYSDNTTVMTTTRGPSPKAFRPPDFPLVRVPMQMRVGDMLAKHNGAVSDNFSVEHHVDYVESTDEFFLRINKAERLIAQGPARAGSPYRKKDVAPDPNFVNAPGSSLPTFNASAPPPGFNPAAPPDSFGAAPPPPSFNPAAPPPLYSPGMPPPPAPTFDLSAPGPPPPVFDLSAPGGLPPPPDLPLPHAAAPAWVTPSLPSVAPSEDDGHMNDADKSMFGEEILEELRARFPDLQVSPSDHPLVVKAQRGEWRDVIDMETLYYMCRTAPENRSRLIASFITNTSNAMQ